MTEYTKTINTSFTVEGEEVYDFNVRFQEWLKEKENNNFRIKLLRSDYSSYPIETKKEKNNDQKDS